MICSEKKREKEEGVTQRGSENEMLTKIVYWQDSNTVYYVSLFLQIIIAMVYVAVHLIELGLVLSYCLVLF